MNRNSFLASFLASLVIGGLATCIITPLPEVMGWRRPHVERPVRPVLPVCPIEPRPNPPVRPINPVHPVRPVDKHRLLVFTAPWCGVCQRVKPAVNQIEASGVIVERINVDEHPDLARKYNVTLLPTFILNPGTAHQVRTNDIEVIEAELN